MGVAIPDATGAAIHEACLDTGFFVVVGHGCAEHIAATFDAAHRFFDLPQATKETLAMVDRRGYVPLERDRLDPGLHASPMEYYDLALDGENPWPPIEGFAAVLQAHQDAALGVAAAVLRALAVSLELDPGFFADRMRTPQCFLRLMHYVPEPDGRTPVLTHPHTDYGAITLLATDGVRGLEVEHPRLGWLPVEAPAGSFIVNLGDMLARWTNLRYASTPHRVLAPIRTDRYSIPFFVNPDPDTVVECLPSCVSVDRPPRFEPVTAGEFLAKRIADGGYMTG